jgi:PAS domain S-box-containing protein
LHDRSIGRNVGNGEILIEGLATDITERKQTEAVLLESEERYHELFNTMTEGFVLRELIFDENGKPYDYLFLDFNTAFEELIGLTRAQLIGRTQREIYPDEDPFWLEIYSRVALGGESVHMEYHPPPYQRYYEAYVYSPVTNQFAVVFRDITERKQAEIELHEKEIQYRNLADSGVALIWSAGTDKLCNYFNEPWLKFTGRTLQQEMGNGWAEGVHPDDLDRCFEIYTTAFDRREPFEMEYRLRHVSGEYRWIQDLGKPVYDGSGEFTGYIGHCFDTTERRQAQEALQVSEQQYRLFAQNLPDITVLLFDHDLRFTLVEGKISAELDLSKEEMIGKSIWEVLPRERAERLAPFYQLALEGVFQKDLPSEYDGRHYIVNIVPIKNEQNEVVSGMVVSQDITERKAAEEEIRRLNLSLEKRVQERTADLSRVNAELEQALKVRDEFLASMSHELRTPLTGILGLSEVLRSDIYGELNDKQRTALSTIEESGRHLLDLINDILDLSKIEAGNLELQLVPCSIEDICRASLHLARGVANRKKQNVYYSPAEESIIVCADARRIKQILINLLGNAIKFTPENGDLGLEVRASRTDGVVKLTVWDKGIGIKPENLEKLFKPFLQINTGLAREYNGTGLGLALVHRLTEMHKGGIEVKSVFGEGSRFTITLPWSQNDTSGCNSPRESAVQTPVSVEQFERSNPPLIMMADDSEEALQMVTDYFEFKNARVITVRSGYELLEKIKEFRPDIMLVDIQMPGMDGLETIHHIRAHEDPLIAKTPVVAVTAMAMVGDRELCLRAGADEYVSKPVKLKELAAIIQKLLKDK